MSGGLKGSRLLVEAQKAKEKCYWKLAEGKYFISGKVNEIVACGHFEDRKYT